MARTWWDTRSIPRKRFKLKSGEVEAVGPVPRGVCVAVLSVCVACPVCLSAQFLPSFPHHESLLIGVIRSLSLPISLTRPSAQSSYLSISLSSAVRSLVHPSRHSSISGKKEDEKQTSEREGARAANCGMQERSHSFLPSVRTGVAWLATASGSECACVIKCFSRMRISWRGEGGTTLPSGNATGLGTPSKEGTAQ